MIDIYAPIIPYEGLGGIKLYSTMKDLRDVITGKNVVSSVISNKWIRFEVDNSISLYFHLFNRKLFKICTLENYKGKLFDKIYVGLPERKLLKAEPTLVYDDFEGVYETPKGAFVETFGKKVKWISVFIREIEDDDFEEANW